MENSVELIYDERRDAFRFKDNDIWYSRKTICPRHNIDLRKIYKYLCKLAGKKTNVTHISFTENNIRYSIDIIRETKQK